MLWSVWGPTEPFLPWWLLPLTTPAPERQVEDPRQWVEGRIQERETGQVKGPGFDSPFFGRVLEKAEPTGGDV